MSNDWSQSDVIDRFSAQLSNLKKTAEHLVLNGFGWRSAVFPAFSGMVAGFASLVFALRSGWDFDNAIEYARGAGIAWGIGMWLAIWVCLSVFLLAVIWFFRGCLQLFQGMLRFKKYQQRTTFRAAHKATHDQPGKSEPSSLFVLLVLWPFLLLTVTFTWLFYLVGELRGEALLFDIAALSQALTFVVCLLYLPKAYRVLKEFLKSITLAETASSVEEFDAATEAFLFKPEDAGQWLANLQDFSDKYVSRV